MEHLEVVVFLTLSFWLSEDASNLSTGAGMIDGAVISGSRILIAVTPWVHNLAQCVV